MRAGAYGGVMHRTYGVLGDEVNMAARLMMACQPGQILVSEAAQRNMEDDFVWELLARHSRQGQERTGHDLCP